MAKPNQIELPDGTRIPILYEDRAIMAIDKPAAWMLAPESWDRTSRNLHLALRSGIQAGDYWARSRNLKYLRFIHRLDADASGVLLLVKNPGAAQAYSRLFETRRVEKTYLVVVQGVPREQAWTCRLKLAPHPARAGRMQTDWRRGKQAETQFRILQTTRDTALVEARPLTGRTHQVRVHLAESGHPVLGDALYGPPVENTQHVQRNRRFVPLALRAVALVYPDPFHHRVTRIEAPVAEFCRRFGFVAPPNS